MKLPIGVYAVSQSFEGAQDTVTFTFQGISYEAQPGVNAFCYLEDLTDAALQLPEQPFCGYGDTPVVILPAGTYSIGTLKETRFRTYLPCAMTILGENAGISPNSRDLRTVNPARGQESVIRSASFYCGCLALRGGVEGTLTLDGLELSSLRVYDERTEAAFAGMTVKNCSITGSQINDLFRILPLEKGQRSTRLSDCRVDGIGSYFGEGRLLAIGSGDVTVERLYFANTEKFPGLAPYSRNTQSRLDSFLLKDCLFEHCACARGLTVLLPAEQTAELRLENCEFLDFANAEEPALLVWLTGDSLLQVANCRFAGAHTAPAILVDGDPAKVTITDSVGSGYKELLCVSPPRRTTPDRNAAYALSDPHNALPEEPSVLNGLYAGRKPFYCDFHCHSNSGGTSDGKTPIGDYVEGMKKLGVDCAAIVDHKQMLHYFLPEWNETYMICGSEPGTRLEGREGSMDYSMIFPDKTGLAQVMGAFPEFGFTGRWDGHFKYPSFTRERFRELGEYIYSIGGLMSHAHPLQLPGTGAPEDYFFSEQIAFETVHADINAFCTRQNHDLWVQMLDQGKRLRTHGSSDSHGPVSNRGLSTVYAEKHFSTDIFNEVRSGNCAAGGVGIQMSIDDCPMGSVTEYAQGKKLYIRVADFHPAHWLPDTVYSLKVYTDQGLAHALEFNGTEPVHLVLPVQQRGYYRCEVTNESDNLPVAFSNPIWLN